MSFQQVWKSTRSSIYDSQVLKGPLSVPFLLLINHIKGLLTDIIEEFESVIFDDQCYLWIVL